MQFTTKNSTTGNPRCWIGGRMTILSAIRNTRKNGFPLRRWRITSRRTPYIWASVVFQLNCCGNLTVRPKPSPPARIDGLRGDIPAIPLNLPCHVAVVRRLLQSQEFLCSQRLDFRDKIIPTIHRRSTQNELGNLFTTIGI